MTPVSDMILDQLSCKKDNVEFLDMLFGDSKGEIIAGKPFVLFGAGIMGGELANTLMNYNLAPEYFCDNDKSKHNKKFRSIPVISFEDLVDRFRDRFVVLSTKTYREELKQQLLESGFTSDQIISNDFDLGLSTFIRDGSQIFVAIHKSYGPLENIRQLVKRDARQIQKAHGLFADQKSRELFVARFSLSANCENMNFIREHMAKWSEPFLSFGTDYSKVPSPESYFYFSNDVFSLSDDEVYVDVGAYDGDSVHTFVDACKKANVGYRHIYAFEPDPENYQALSKNTSSHDNLTCLQLGLWSKNETLRFASSETAPLPSSSEISDDGNITINAITLDEFAQDKRVSILKMDCPGETVNRHVLSGAKKTLVKDRPKIIVSVDKSIESLYEMPLFILGINSTYKFYLRHNSWCLGEICLYAI